MKEFYYGRFDNYSNIFFCFTKRVYQTHPIQTTVTIINMFALVHTRLRKVDKPFKGQRVRFYNRIPKEIRYTIADYYLK